MAPCATGLVAMVIYTVCVNCQFVAFTVCHRIGGNGHLIVVTVATDLLVPIATLISSGTLRTGSVAFEATLGQNLDRLYAK